MRAVVLTKAERFENFRNRAIPSPIAFSMPARSSDDTIVSATVTLRNKAPSASEIPRRILPPTDQDNDPDDRRSDADFDSAVPVQRF